MTKIVFDFDEIKDFIDGVEEEHVGRCNERYYTRYRLTDDGEIEYENYAYRMIIDEGWKKEGIKGEIINELHTKD